MKKSFLKKWAVLGMSAVVLGGGLAGCGEIGRAHV